MQKLAFVVEDEENIREVIRCTLESCGLAVKGFEDADSMLAQLPAQTPDLVLLDLMLPGTDGMETLHRMKAGPYAAVPVIILTARSSETDVVAGLDEGADDYVTKPFGVLELMARVRAVLRRGTPAEPENEVLECRGVKLDSARHEVTVDGRLVALTLKEFELLQVLMENRGSVMSRNVLLDRIWGYDYAGETRTLDMHVRSLRHKLGDDAETERYIGTVRGVGYRFHE